MFNKQTQFQGGKIVTDLLDVNWIQANVVKAEYIEALEMVVKSLKTAAIGKRVEILASQNDISFYDGTGTRVLWIDDDSAVQDGTFESPQAVYDEAGNEGWISTRYDSPTATVMYRYLNYDAGMSVGYGLKDSGGFTAIGRKKIFTTGSLEASNPSGTEKSTITKDSIKSTGGLEIGGSIKVMDGVTQKTGVSGRFAGSFSWNGGPVFFQHLTIVNGVIVEQGAGG